MGASLSSFQESHDCSRARFTLVRIAEDWINGHIDDATARERASAVTPPVWVGDHFDGHWEGDAGNDMFAVMRRFPNDGARFGEMLDAG